jgi:hypothetical protein
MAKKLDRYRETARLVLEPWLAEAALACLNRTLSPANNALSLMPLALPIKSGGRSGGGANIGNPKRALGIPHTTTSIYVTEIRISPSPSIPPVITSPRSTGPTPSGVPVMMISPGFKAIEWEQIEIISETGQISLEMSESCFIAPLTASQIRPVFGCLTSDTGRSGAMGADRSKPLPQSQGRPCSRACSCRSRRVRSMPTP